MKAKLDLCTERQDSIDEHLMNTLFVGRDAKGEKVVVIPQVIFKGKRSISWEEVEKYLLRYIGKIFEVSETEDLILIDNN